ncbi:MAG: SIR2 family protein [Pelosinus sp.]|nr:SIR2 family protein [Pelosinus sp.]
MTNYKEIPDLNEYPPILKAARDGKLIVFVGAGVSRLMGYSSWKTYADKKVEFLRKNKLVNYYICEKLKSFDPRKTLSLCEIILRENDIPFPDDVVFLRPDRISDCGIYKDLYSFNAVYVTTNYDDCLDKVAEENAMEISPGSQDNPQQNKIIKQKVFFLEEEMLVSKLLEPGNVLHIHGSVKYRGSRIVTVQDYMKRYGRDSKLQTLLEEMFAKFTVLFIGYGLEEYEILDFIVNAAHRGQRIQNEHYYLYSIFSTEKELCELNKKYYHDLNVELIPYLIDKNGYEGLVNVVHNWAQILAPIARNPFFIESKKMIDEVI